MLAYALLEIDDDPTPPQTVGPGTCVWSGIDSARAWVVRNMEADSCGIYEVALPSEDYFACIQRGRFFDTLVVDAPVVRRVE